MGGGVEFEGDSQWVVNNAPHTHFIPVELQEHKLPTA